MEQLLILNGCVIAALQYVVLSIMVCQSEKNINKIPLY